MKTQTERHEVESSSSNRKWVVSKYDDGSWACSCPKWIFHRGERVNCKHINKVIEEATLTIQGIKNE